MRVLVACKFLGPVCSAHSICAQYLRTVLAISTVYLHPRSGRVYIVPGVLDKKAKQCSQFEVSVLNSGE